MTDLSKIVSSITATATGTKLSNDFFAFVKSIGESKSKDEEDRIIENDISQNKKKLTEANVSGRRRMECIMRSIYADMLGHDASFAHIHAVNMTQENCLHHKRVGYLACVLFLQKDHELSLLLINTLRKDLMSSNILKISAALSCILRLLNVDMIPVIQPLVVNLLTFNNETIRKKACIVLCRLLSMNPSYSLPAARENIRRLMTDTDPSVRAASLFLLEELMKLDVALSKECLPLVISILKQLTDHRLSRDYDYHRISAPWTQVQAMSLLARLGKSDAHASENIYPILQSIMTSSEMIISNASYVIAYECIRAATAIYPQTKLLQTAANAITKFITSDNNNLKCVGLTGIATLIKIEPSIAAKHQLIVVECLDDPDETIKRKTLELLVEMTNHQNIDTVVNKLFQHLTATMDVSLQRALVSRVLEITERYAPDNQRYIDILIEAFEKGGDFILSETAYNLLRLIAEGPQHNEELDTEFRRYAVNCFVQLLESMNNPLPKYLMQVVLWSLGEYGYLLDDVGYSIEDLCDLLCEMRSNCEDNDNIGWLLQALTRLSTNENFNDATRNHVKDLLEKYCFSSDPVVQQRACQFRQLLKHDSVLRKVLPCNSFDSQSLIIVDANLPFLDEYVGSITPHKSFERVSAISSSITASLPLPSEVALLNHQTSAKSVPLKFEPYEAPKVQWSDVSNEQHESQEAVSEIDMSGSKASDSFATEPTELKLIKPGFKVPGTRRWAAKSQQKNLSKNTDQSEPSIPEKVMSEDRIETPDQPSKVQVEIETIPAAIVSSGPVVSPMSEKAKVAAALFGSIEPNRPGTLSSRGRGLGARLRRSPMSRGSVDRGPVDRGFVDGGVPSHRAISTSTSSSAGALSYWHNHTEPIDSKVYDQEDKVGLDLLDLVADESPVESIKPQVGLTNERNEAHEGFQKVITESGHIYLGHSKTTIEEIGNMWSKMSSELRFTVHLSPLMNHTNCSDFLNHCQRIAGFDIVQIIGNEGIIGAKEMESQSLVFCHANYSQLSNKVDIIVKSSDSRLNQEIQSILMKIGTEFEL